MDLKIALLANNFAHSHFKLPKTTPNVSARLTQHDLTYAQNQRDSTHVAFYFRTTQAETEAIAFQNLRNRFFFQIV